MASVACIEVNPTKAFFHLSPYEDFRKFEYMHIQMYPSVTLSLLSDILRQPSNYFVIDFGVLNANTYLAYSRCDCKIMLGNICPWKWQSYKDYLQTISETHENIYKDITLLGIPGEKENLQLARRHISSDLGAVPFISNPFHITSEDFGFFEGIIKNM